MTEPHCFGFIIDFHVPLVYNSSGQSVHDMTKWDVGLYIDFHDALIMLNIEQL